MSSTHVSQDAFIFPTSAMHTPAEEDSSQIEPLSASISSVLAAGSVSDLSSSTSTISTQRGGVMTPRGRPASCQPSGISLLRAHQDGAGSQERIDGPSTSSPTVKRVVLNGKAKASPTSPPSTTSSGSIAPSHVPDESDDMHEQQPLLWDVENGHTAYSSVSPGRSSKTALQRMANSWRHRIATAPKPDFARHILSDTLHAIPAVVLGTLLNILDGISCEFI